MSGFVGILLIAAGATPASVPPEIAQVVLSKLIADSSANFVLCLKIDAADPPVALLHNLQRPDRTIVLGSECHDWVDMNHPDYHIKTGRPAHFLTVSGFVRESEAAAQVQAMDHHNGKWAKFWTVRLMRDAAGWKVVSFHLDGEA